MITSARDFLAFIKETANEDFDEEAVSVMEGIVDGWTEEIVAAPAELRDKVRGSIYQGGILGLNIAARMLRQRFRAAGPTKGEDVGN